jgi:hypothetical protein
VSLPAAARSLARVSISVSSKRCCCPLPGRMTIEREVSSSSGCTGRAPASALRAAVAPP